MSTKIYPQGKAEFTLAALDDLAVYSDSDFNVYIEADPANFPGSYTLNTSGAGGIESTVAATSVARKIRIEASKSPVLYQEGTEANILERRGLRGQATPKSFANTAAATSAAVAAGIANGICVTVTTAAITFTLPTGALMDSSFEMNIGDSFDWSVIVTGANATTVAAAATGHTVVGTMAVATATSAMFRTRKTAVATYVTYLIG